MMTALEHRRKVAVRLLLVEAGLLAAILAGLVFAVFWLLGTASIRGILLAGGGLMATVLVGNWILVRRNWARIAEVQGGLHAYRRKHLVAPARIAEGSLRHIGSARFGVPFSCPETCAPPTLAGRPAGKW